VDERGKGRFNYISRQPESSCMDIRFECEKCGQLLVVDEAGAGISIPCPSCSANLIVPVADKTTDKPASDFFSKTRELKNAVVKAAVSLLFPPGANIPEACFDVWDNRARARGEILTELRRIGSVPKETALQDILNDITSLDSILKTIQDVACGVDHFMEQNYDEIRVDEFPALQFHRVYSRQTSRDWPARWIYDQDHRCLTLVNLLHTIKANLHFFSEADFRNRLAGNAFVDYLAKGSRIPKEEELESDIEAVSAGCKNHPVTKLRFWRDHIVAHHNAKLDLGKNPVLEDNPLSEMEIEQLLENSLTIFNKYSSLYKASTHSTKLLIIGQDDYKSLLKFIGLGLQKWDEDKF